MITIDDFHKLDLHIGKIIRAEFITGAKYSTHKLCIDFGPEIGTKTSCARLVNYSIQELTNKLIIGVVNLPPRQIGKNISEVLILGVPDNNSECILILPDQNNVSLGVKVY